MVDGEFDNLTVNNILTIGADTNLYRSAADVLRTPDHFTAEGNITTDGILFIQPDAEGYTLQIGRFSATYPNAYIACHPDDTDSGFQFRTRSSSTWINVGAITKDGQWQMPVPGSTGGLLIGGDVDLYRNSANVLKTDDSLYVGTKLGIGTNPSYDLHIVNNTKAEVRIQSTQDAELYIEADTDNTTETEHPKLALVQDGGAVQLVMEIGDNDASIMQTYSAALQFGTNNIARWKIGSSGHFIPATADTYDLGGTSNEIRNVYVGNTGRIYFGSSQDVNLYHSDVNVLKTDDVFQINKVGDFERLQFVNDTTLNLDIGVYYPSSKAFFANKLNGDVGFEVNATERMTLKSSGQLQLPREGSIGGLVIGDVHLFNNGTDELSLANEGGKLSFYAPNGYGNSIQAINGMTPEYPPLRVSYGLVADDIQANGFVSTTSMNLDDDKGGGAILMGHGFTDSSDMPCIWLSDYNYKDTGVNYQTLWIKKYDGIHGQVTQLPWGDVELGNLTAHYSLNSERYLSIGVLTNTNYIGPLYTDYYGRVGYN